MTKEKKEFIEFNYPTAQGDYPMRFYPKLYFKPDNKVGYYFFAAEYKNDLFPDGAPLYYADKIITGTWGKPNRKNYFEVLQGYINASPDRIKMMENLAKEWNENPKA